MPYLLDAVLIAFLERKDLISALLRVIDLLPSLLLFLLEQGDAVRQQLGVSLDTTDGKESDQLFRER